MKMSGRLESTENLSFKTSMNAHSDDDDDDDDDESPYSSSTANKRIPAPDYAVSVLKNLYDINKDEDFLPEIIVSHSHSEMVLGRVVQWRGSEKESSTTKVSSVVEIKLDAEATLTNPTFGQIQHFFSHTRDGKITKFAVLQMFEHHYTTRTSHNQWTVIPQHSKKVVIPAGFEFISKPLVTARPVGNKDILYILNN